MRTPGKKASQVVNPVGSASVVGIAEEAVQKRLEMQKRREERESADTSKPEDKRKESKGVSDSEVGRVLTKAASRMIPKDVEEKSAPCRTGGLDDGEEQNFESLIPQPAPTQPKGNEQVVEQPKIIPQSQPKSTSPQLNAELTEDEKKKAEAEAEALQANLRQRFAHIRTGLVGDENEELDSMYDESFNFNSCETVEGRPQARVIYKAQGSKSSSAPLVGIVAQHHTSGLVGTGVASNPTLVLT